MSNGDFPDNQGLYSFHSYTFEQLLKEQDSQQGTSSSTTVRGRTHGSKEVTVKLKVKINCRVLLVCVIESMPILEQSR